MATVTYIRESKQGLAAMKVCKQKVNREIKKICRMEKGIPKAASRWNVLGGRYVE